jgi:hypothetical protein
MAFQFMPNERSMTQTGWGDPRGGGSYGQTSTPGGWNGHTLVSERNPMQELLLGSGQYSDRMKRDDAMKNMQGMMGMFGLGGGTGSGSGSSGGPAAEGYDALKDEMLGLAGQQGASRTQGINRAFDADLDSQISRLYDRGFGNSSLVNNVQSENNDGRQRALTDLGDSLLSQKIGIGSNIGLAGLDAQSRNNSMQQQFQYQLLGGLFGGMFG